MSCASLDLGNVFLWRWCDYDVTAVRSHKKAIRRRAACRSDRYCYSDFIDKDSLEFGCRVTQSSVVSIDARQNEGSSFCVNSTFLFVVRISEFTFGTTHVSWSRVMLLHRRRNRYRSAVSLWWCRVVSNLWLLKTISLLTSRRCLSVSFLDVRIWKSIMLRRRVWWRISWLTRSLCSGYEVNLNRDVHHLTQFS